ncbi:hypothetical protein [Geomonas anaerohicana]|uniref:ATP-binding protein n=1 Tax=Geomonas anaerohicana TaxID=2798583 RepID=A0ABS0YK20_9BACT|nr:hypothetical protein [Geomonas anaerohicana]MBJ6752683.1 hypothetical protein [Geomonas anaerohicana]
MGMNTNLLGRVKHTSLPKTSGLLPLFEAVVNSIHSIEEAGLRLDLGRIDVEIIRGEQSQFDYDASENKPGREPLAEIIGFKVHDNGVGFSDRNFLSFKTLDSDYKIDKGCRGVGRLLWLKAFNKVGIESIYREPGGTLLRRTFDFDPSAGVVNEKTAATTRIDARTSVHLDGFMKGYREASKKSAESIAKSLFEHCLWYYVRPDGAPQIFIIDGTDTFNLDEIYESNMRASAKQEQIKIK